MLAADFEALKDEILARNTYFRQGFANVYKDDTNHFVCSKDGAERKIVFPASHQGNFFYLRVEPRMRHDAQPPERVTDTGTQRLSYLDSATVYLVAVVNDADAPLLIQNLRNTTMTYEPLNVLHTYSHWSREEIVADELRGARQEDVQAALQRLTKETIVKLTLNITKLFIPGNCIVNPVKP